MNREELATKSREELVEIAEKLKIKVHHKAKPETIIHQICQQPEAYQRDAMKHVAETPVAPVVENTEDDIRNALQHLIDKGLELSFKGDGTWYISFKNKWGKREESGNMQIPLRIIRSKAENVSRGYIPMKSLGNDGTYPNQYTDNILMG